MGYSARVSLRHEYERFVEHEIEDYKDRVSRSAILKIADEAAQRLYEQEQVTLNELVLWIEVDRIIAARLRLPGYPTWARRRRKVLQQLRRPEAWGLTQDAAVVRNVRVPGQSHPHVLVVRPSHDQTALFLAANGCTVTAVDPEPDIVQRVMHAAEEHGLSARVHPAAMRIESWSPDAPLAAVVCTPAAFAGLTADGRARVIRVLQSATRDGGVHLVETIVAGRQVLDLDELQQSYAGWTVSIENGSGGATHTFVARKA
jgi:hypothetical protein